MEWLVDILRDNPVIPIFLTIGLGFWLGGLKVKSFSLGPILLGGLNKVYMVCASTLMTVCLL